MKVYDKLELNEFSGSTRKSGFKTPCYENVTISSRRVNQEKKHRSNEPVLSFFFQMNRILDSLHHRL